MDITIIILGVIVVILIYILYKYFTTASTLTKKAIYLGDTSIADIPAANIINPKSNRYSYGVWVYVNTWNGAVKPLIYRAATAPIGTSSAAEFALYLEATQPVLHAIVNNQDIAVTDNFPIQKWVFIIISVDGQFVDCYLDGKLVKSTKITLPGSNSEGMSIKFGTGSDIYLSNVQRLDKPTDPKTAWTTYMDGNGVASALSSYNVNLSLIKDNVEQNKFALF